MWLFFTCHAEKEYTEYTIVYLWWCSIILLLSGPIEMRTRQKRRRNGPDPCVSCLLHIQETERTGRCGGVAVVFPPCGSKVNCSCLHESVSKRVGGERATQRDGMRERGRERAREREFKLRAMFWDKLIC